MYHKIKTTRPILATKPLRSDIVVKLSKGSPPCDHPSNIWCSRWFNSCKYSSDFHQIKTKPVAQACLEAHSGHQVKEWLVDHRKWLKIRRIKKTERIWNVDETGAKIRSPFRELVTTLSSVKELYTNSPENRITVSVVEIIHAVGAFQSPVPIHQSI